MRDFYEFRDNFLSYKHVKSELIISGEVEKPDISIFIPTYKRAETLIVTVESAIDQIGDYNYEILVVNNAPEEVHGDTTEFLEELHNDKIYYYVNNENIGLCGNWNRGLELCRGRYVAMIHDDDVLSPWFLTSMIKAIEDNNEPFILGVCSTNFSSKNKPQFSKPGMMKYRAVSKRSFFFGRYITIAGMTVDREKALRLGGYCEDFYPNEDTIFIYQALLKGKVINIDNVLAGYRKELNLSLSEKTMRKIIEYTEYTRKNIAKHESFAKVFMKYFDREYLYSYAEGANNNWGTDVDIDEIMKEFKLPEGRPNTIKLKIMRALCKIGRI